MVVARNSAVHLKKNIKFNPVTVSLHFRTCLWNKWYFEITV